MPKDAGSQVFRDNWRAAKERESGKVNDPVKKTGHYAEKPLSSMSRSEREAKLLQQRGPHNSKGYKPYDDSGYYEPGDLARGPDFRLTKGNATDNGRGSKNLAHKESSRGQ